jgi:hypothetical protein
MPDFRQACGAFLVIFLSLTSLATSLPANKISVGPEIYYLERKKEGGSKQHGMMYGVRGSYDRLKRYKWYIGGEALYAEGRLRGHTKSAKLKSTMVQESAEGRFGYTFQAKNSWKPSFTPYIGYGYYRESNHFHSPSPLKVKLINDYSYFGYGFLSSAAVCLNITVGFNAKFRSMYDARCHVKKDSEAENKKMLIKDKLQYRLELPLYYDFCFCNLNAEIGLVPFFESQHYGGRENYPNDFFDTKLWLYGANLQLTCRF